MKLEMEMELEAKRPHWLCYLEWCPERKSKTYLYIWTRVHLIGSAFCPDFFGDSRIEPNLSRWDSALDSRRASEDCSRRRADFSPNDCRWSWATFYSPRETSDLMGRNGREFASQKSFMRFKRFQNISNSVSRYILFHLDPLWWVIDSVLDQKRYLSVEWIL